METSQTICQWGSAAFGDADSVLAYVDRAQIELNELREAVIENNSEAAVIMEAADVAILLHRLVGVLGHELSELVDQKMATNRHRQWDASGDGTGQHI